MNSVLDLIENECDRLLKMEGKLPSKIYLGKKQMSIFMEELMDLQNIPKNMRAYTRQQMEESDMMINDVVSVVPTDLDDELRIETKISLLN